VAVDYRTVTQRLPLIAKPEVQHALSAACAEHTGLGPASVVVLHNSTLYFQTDTADGYNQPGFSKERRLEPQITIGLPPAVEAFEGNRPNGHHGAGYQTRSRPPTSSSTSTSSPMLG
jgi:hypothetical protein